MPLVQAQTNDAFSRFDSSLRKAQIHLRLCKWISLRMLAALWGRGCTIEGAVFSGSEGWLLIRGTEAGNPRKRGLAMFNDEVSDTLEEPILERDPVCSQNRMEVPFEVWINFDDDSA